MAGPAEAGVYLSRWAPGCSSGLGGIDARQRLGALELVAQVAVEVGLPTRVQVHHRDVPEVRPAGEAAA